VLVVGSVSSRTVVVVAGSTVTVEDRGSEGTGIPLPSSPNPPPGS
jgi:hypothetical protein